LSLIDEHLRKSAFKGVMLALMPKSNQQSQRGVFLTEDQDGELERYKASTDIPVTAIIRRAIEAYAAMPYEPRQRLLLGPRDVRRLVYIPDDIWNALKNRKAETGLDLNEQVQIAVALYLQNEAQNAPRSQGERPIPQTSTDAPDDLELTPPPFLKKGTRAPLSEAEEQRLRQLIADVFKEEKSNLIEELRAEGIDARPVRPAIMQETRSVPVTMVVVCGEDDADMVVEPFEDGGITSLTGDLAKKVTPRSFIALAKGWSMANENSPLDIRPGDELLMTPIDEFPYSVEAGMVVLAEVEFKDGRRIRTLKMYTGRNLKANNPNFRGVDFGKDVKRARLIAICRGIKEKLFK
jgi:hypothetical protein